MFRIIWTILLRRFLKNIPQWSSKIQWTMHFFQIKIGTKYSHCLQRKFKVSYAVLKGQILPKNRQNCTTTYTNPNVFTDSLSLRYEIFSIGTTPIANLLTLICAKKSSFKIWVLGTRIKGSTYHHSFVVFTTLPISASARVLKPYFK